MKDGSSLKFLLIEKTARSLHELIADGQYRTTFVGRRAWQSLLDSYNLSGSYEKEGFNVRSGSGNKVARLGIIAYNESSCAACDTCIGVGTNHISDVMSYILVQ